MFFVFFLTRVPVCFYPTSLFSFISFKIFTGSFLFFICDIYILYLWMFNTPVLIFSNDVYINTTQNWLKTEKKLINLEFLYIKTYLSAAMDDGRQVILFYVMLQIIRSFASFSMIFEFYSIGFHKKARHTFPIFESFKIYDYLLVGKVFFISDELWIYPDGNGDFGIIFDDQLSIGFVCFSFSYFTSFFWSNLSSFKCKGLYCDQDSFLKNFQRVMRSRNYSHKRNFS